MIHIAICDDNQKCIGETHTLLERLQEKYHYDLQIEEYSSGTELLTDMGQGTDFELLYLDIEMEGMGGIETASRIRQKDNRMLIVYVSSHEEYLRELFETEPFRFLSKPIAEEQFEDVFLKAVRRISSQLNSYFHFQIGKTVVKVLARDILYVESAKRKVIVHTVAHTYEYYDKLDRVEEKLGKMRFVRIHKAYLVNMDNIEAFQYDRVALTDGTILSISEKNRPRIREMFWEYCKEDGADG